MSNKIIGIRFFGNNKIYSFNNEQNHNFKIDDKAMVLGRDGVPTMVTVVRIKQVNSHATKPLYKAGTILQKRPVTIFDKRLPDL